MHGDIPLRDNVDQGPWELHSVSSGDLKGLIFRTQPESRNEAQRFGRRRDKVVAKSYGHGPLSCIDPTEK